MFGSLSVFARSYDYSDELPTGQVIPQVVSLAESKYSYAIYLPSYYSAERSFPVIIAFDPGARGIVPVSRFKDAAEKYGYILVASNNSRNGLPNAISEPIINDVIGETLKRFLIDRNRVYLAGLSGGARLALGIALAMKGGAAGVVICGAGFPPNSEPTKDLPFVIYGTVGDEDFNYSEMRMLNETLSKLNLAHHIQIFEGTHEWASSELCIKAVEWLELQAMKTNRRKRDDAFVDSGWKRQSEEAAEFQASGKAFENFNAVNALVQDFRVLRDVSEMEKNLAALREDKAVKQALKNDKEDIAKEARLANQLISPGMELIQSNVDDPPGKIKEIRDLAVDIRKRSEITENTADRRLTRRVLRSALAYYRETATLNFIPNKKYDAALVYLAIGAELAPKNSMIPIEVARIYAITNQKKQALRSLQSGVEKGYSDIKALENDKAFEGLHGERDWTKLIEKMKTTPSPKGVK